MFIETGLKYNLHKLPVQGVRKPIDLTYDESRQKTALFVLHV